MNLYQSLSALNMVMLAIGLVWMVRVLVKYEVATSWHLFYLLSFALTFYFFLTQVYTLYDPGHGEPLVKLVVTVYAIKVFVFCYSITKVSMVKKNYN